MSKSRDEQLNKLYLKYELTSDDVFKHQHYNIITRSGIDKIQAKENITILYDPIVTERDYWAVKARATHHGEYGDTYIETFGSALKGDYLSGNTNTWYIAEMAEKRAMSRAVLKLTGFYQLGTFGEDESEQFKRK